MTISKRLFALLMALAMCFALAACKNESGADSTPSDSPSADPSAGSSDAVSSDIEVDLTQNLYEFASGLDPNGTAVTVNGTAIPNEMFLYWLASNCDTLYAYYQNYYSYYGMTLDFSDPDTMEYLLSSTQDIVVYSAIMRELCEQNGITVTDEQLADLQDQIDQFGEIYGEDNYQNLVASYGSEDTFQYINTNGYMYTNLADVLIGEPTGADLEQYVSDNGIYYAKHILISTTDSDITDSDGNVTQTADEYNADALARAEDILAQINASGDPLATFDELMNEYSEDPGLASYPDGYETSTGEMVSEFENAALALGDNEISGIVQSSFGYHIIQRLPVDASVYRDEWIDIRADSLITEAINAAEVTVSDDFANLDLASFYARFIAYTNILFANMTSGS